MQCQSFTTPQPSAEQKRNQRIEPITVGRSE
jgi:hypothetical protein